MTDSELRAGETVYMNCTKEPWKVTVLKVDGPIAVIHVPSTGQMLEVPVSALYR